MLRRICAFLISSGSFVLLLLVVFAGCSSMHNSAMSPATPAGPSSGSGSGGSGGSGGGGGSGSGGGSGGSGGGTGSGGGSGSGSSGSAPAAYVYVSNQPAGANSGQYQVAAYAADANGQLTPVPGSPFNDDVSSIATNGTYLMGSTETALANAKQSTPYINSYKIGMDGSLSIAAETNLDQFGSGCVDGGGPEFDRSGQTLYVVEDNFDCTGSGDAGNAGVGSFAVDSTSGKLNYLGGINTGRFGGMITVDFTGNNQYAYGIANDGCMYYSSYGFARSSDGTLSFNSSYAAPPLLTPPPGTSGELVHAYYPGLSATDNANHVAFAEWPCWATKAGTPVQLAVYTADANGKLSTNDDYSTMPATKVSNPSTMKISPSGTLLAIAGQGGLQVFHFNGGNSITSDTDLLTTDNIKAIAWDNSNHLYAITADHYAGTSTMVNANKLYVFTITDTAATQAAGSPYTVAFPVDIAVQTKGTTPY